VSPYSDAPRRLRKTFAASGRPIYKSDKLATRVDIALLVSALFLPRFALPFGSTFLHLDLVMIGLILLYQFVCGKVLIQYDRFLWFLALTFAVTCSLLLNFNSTMLTAYAQSLVLNSLATLGRPSTVDQYKRTLKAFQFLVILLSYCAMVQLGAHFVGEEYRLMKFYGVFPDFLFGSAGIDAPLGAESHFRSNGIFLTEPSMLSQITGIGILIEVMEFRRPRYLVVITIGFLLAYSGTGSLLLLLFLPMAGLRGRAALSALLVVIFGLGLFATGTIDLSAFTSRAGEFDAPGSSGFSRFVSPFWVAAKQFDFEALQALLVGSGPGTAKFLVSTPEMSRYTGNFSATWINIMLEYGLIGSFILACFLASCLRRSRCPGLVVAAIIFAWLFLQGMMTMTIPLCTLSGPKPRPGRIDETNQDRPSLVAEARAI
jgi:hypothetical protein